MTFAALDVVAMRDVLSLPSCASKLVMYLASRADQYGVCFPPMQVVADESRMSVRSAYRGLRIAVAHGWVRLVRWNQYDVVTGKKLPNVYIVSAELIRFHAPYQSRHDEIWNGSQGFTTEIVCQESINNHHQRTTDKKHRQETTDNNHHHHQPPTFSSTGDGFVETTDTNPNRADTPRRKHKKASVAHSPQHQNATRQPQSPPSSDAPPPSPSPFRRDYINPDAITEPLETDAESVAVKASELGISLNMARGLVIEYGTNAVSRATEIVYRKRGDSHNPAGLFRFYLQKGFADTWIPSDNDFYSPSEPF